MKSKRVYLMIFLSGFLMACTNEQKPSEPEETVVEDIPELVEWMDFEYDSSLIYLYNLDANYESFGRLVVKDDQLDSTVIIESGIKLSKSDINQIGNIMKGEASDENLMIADCIEPHHGVVFYHSGLIVSHISICTMCNTLSSYPEENYLTDVRRFEPIIKRLKLPVFKSLDEINSYGNKESDL